MQLRQKKEAITSLRFGLWASKKIKSISQLIAYSSFCGQISFVQIVGQPKAMCAASKFTILSGILQIAAGRTVSEVEVDTFLTGQRKAQSGFIEPSFPTIAGMNWDSNIFPNFMEQHPIIIPMRSPCNQNLMLACRSQ